MSASFVLKHHPDKTVPEQLMFPQGKPLPLPWPTSHCASGKLDALTTVLDAYMSWKDRCLLISFVIPLPPPTGFFYTLH